MQKIVLMGLFLAATLPHPVSAHDYWLQPKRFFLANGETTQVHLFVGDHFVSGAERPFQEKQTVSFQLISSKSELDLKSSLSDGQKPVCKISPTTPGNHLVVMERDWSVIEIEAKKFNDYLEHEGLVEILKKRRQSGEDKMVGRERYRRYLKALVQVGPRSDNTYSKKLGHRLEIVPLSNPYTSEHGDSLSLLVLFEDKPLGGVQLAAYNRASGKLKTQLVRTDRLGRAQVSLDRSGVWLVRLVHMQRVKNVEGIDWESFWAAYSFEMK